MTPLPPPLAYSLAILVVTAAIFDIWSRTIPNWLALMGLAAGIGGSIYFGRITDSLLGFGLALFVYLLFYVLRAMGGGDVKLMAAIGSIAGPQNWLILFVLTAFFGGVAAILVLIWTGGLWRAVRNIGHILMSLGQGRAPHRSREELNVDSPKAVTLPHGVAIALGSLAFLLAS